jgi:hypothetical protein
LADSLSGENYSLLRIEQNFVGISLGLVVAIMFFPIFSIDLLKENIRK